MVEISLIGLIGVIGLIGAMMVVAAGDKGDGRGLWGQGSVFADFMRSCWLSDGCGRCRRPCPRLMHSEPSRLAVVTAFSLKVAAALEGAVGGSEHSEHSESAEAEGGWRGFGGIGDLGLGFDFSAGACRYVFLRG